MASVQSWASTSTDVRRHEGGDIEWAGFSLNGPVCFLFSIALSVRA